MKKELTPEKVFAVCDRLTRENRKVSARAVLAETGGSMSLVIEYVRQWKQQQSTLKDVEGVLSEPLKAAILAEIRNHTAALKNELQRQIADAEERARENTELLAEAEARIEELSAELQREHEERARDRQEAERNKALHEQRTATAEQRAEKAESLRELQTEAEKRAAVAEARLEDKDRQIDSLMKQLMEAEARTADRDKQILSLSTSLEKALHAKEPKGKG